MDREDSRRLAAEVFGTFALVFAGTGAIVINDISDHAITHVGIALTFGWIVLAMIYAIGDISGCHLNPAVTLGFVAAGRMEKRLVIPYIVSQSAGAILASTVLKMLFPEHSTLGATLPRGSDWQSFILEILLTMILMVVILCVSSGSKEKGVLAGVAVGSVIALEAMFAGPISGASMNPARSLAPALVSGHLASLWVYLVAPVIGATLAIPIFRVLYMSEQRGVGP
jgi:aquaporin Z